MKNILFMAMSASMLFAISAGLSLWLQSSKNAELAKDEKDKEKSKEANKDTTKETSKETSKEATKETAKKTKDESHGEGDTHDKPKATKPPEKGDPKPLTLTPPAASNDQATQRLRQMELVLQDIRVEQDSLNKLSKQLLDEAKAIQVRAEELETKPVDASKTVEANAKAAAELKKTQLEQEATEKKNLERIAALSDSMPPETTAKVLQQLADGGKMDTAVKVLSQMKERQAARVLAEMPDPALAAQLLDKMRTLKRPAPAPASP